MLDDLTEQHEPLGALLDRLVEGRDPQPLCQRAHVTHLAVLPVLVPAADPERTERQHEHMREAIGDHEERQGDQ